MFFAVVFLRCFLFVLFCSCKQSEQTTLQFIVQKSKFRLKRKNKSIRDFSLYNKIIYLHILAPPPHRYSHLVFIFINISFKCESVCARDQCVSLDAILHLLLNFHITIFATMTRNDNNNFHFRLDKRIKK